MFRLTLLLTYRLHPLLQRAPTNRLLTWLRRRDRLRFGVPFMLLGVGYLLAAAALSVWIRGGGPEWLHLLVLLGVWNGFKFLAFGPVSLVLLIRARIREALAGHRLAHAAERDRSVF